MLLVPMVSWSDWSNERGQWCKCHVTSLLGVRIMRPGAGNTQWSSWPGHGLSLALLWAKKRGMWRYGQEYSRLSPLKCSCGFLMTPAVWQGYSWPMTQWPVGWNSSLFRQFLLETRVNERERVSQAAACSMPHPWACNCFLSASLACTAPPRV